MHFDHERIPERVVHARGAGAHGVFTLHTSLAKYTTAKVLTEVGAQTEMFVRFSTVNGSRGSADTARDARGFATKFYTKDGIWDLVGNNIPVFFIQDAIKFPDLVHSFKPEPDVEIPQASTAHDTFYDFISLTPESMHMIMWVMSDRGIPRSYRMMEGFGIHTFRLVNAAGKSTFVKFHWKPQLGVHSLVWNEAQKLAGFDPDFHRRDLAQAIDWGQFPQYDLGVQLLAEADVAKVQFDILDPTKIWPEEIVPVQRVGTMMLNRNPDNYFAETEQVGVLHGARGARHRLHRRPAAAGPQLLLLRHPAQPLQRAELDPAADQPAAQRRQQLPAGRVHAVREPSGQGQLRAELARRPDAPSRRLPRAASSRTRSRCPAPRSGRAARRSPTTSARRRCSSRASPRSRSSTSSRRCSSSWARSPGSRSSSAC